MEHKEIVDTLNPLIETSRDGDKGFTEFAEDAGDPALKIYFTTCAARCRESVGELERLVDRFGGTPASAGTIAAGARRAYNYLRSAIGSNNDFSLLEACESGEDSAKAAYVKALQQALPLEVRSVVEKQFEGVRHHHDHIRKLRDALAPAIV